MHTYHTPLDLVRERPPERPVALVRPDAVALAARWFRQNLSGETFYAVKANPSPWVIRALVEGGVEAFDVASIPEIELVRALAPGAKIAFMNPVKSRAAIAAAYFDHRVRTFCLDSPGELEKIAVAVGGARDLDLIVRLAIETSGAAYSLCGKFGVAPAGAPDLLLAARRASGAMMGVSFHVGSQCLRPAAFELAMAQASRALVRAGVMADVVDVGGGFPSVYPGMDPPPLADYAAAIERGFSRMSVHESAALWCEPGRALVAEAGSLLVRVDLRRADALYVNDGAYGSLFDAAHNGWPFPVKLVREGGEASALLRPFRFFGPTCDSIDVMPGPFWLPEDIGEGDYVEIGMLGAYGVALASRFNGFGEVETARVMSAPMASMFGLAPRTLARSAGFQPGLIARRKGGPQARAPRPR
ncbi:MAG: type III PLP-dependent enzyme [Caulobacteraceae bacterium]